MNANVVSGVGREEQGPLPEDLMAHTVTETVYLGRASFRITHELEAVGAEDTAAASSEWFSHDAAVILEGGPNGLTARDKQVPGEDEDDAATARPTRGLPRAWLLIGLPVAFGLGIAVASVAGSSAARHKIVAPSAVTPVTTAAPAASAPAPVALPVAAPVATAPALPAAAPAAALPPSTVALTVPVATEPAAATPEAHPALAAVPHVIRPAAKPRVAKKAKASKAADPAEAETSSDASPPDEASTVPAIAPKKAAVKWVDPWAN